MSRKDSIKMQLVKCGDCGQPHQGYGYTKNSNDAVVSKICMSCGSPSYRMKPCSLYECENYLKIPEVRLPKDWK